MKKTITILLALVMVLSLAACGGGNQTANTPAPTIKAEQTPEPMPEPTKDPNAIELTTDNYKKYLNITGRAFEKSTENNVGDFIIQREFSIGNRIYTMCTLYKNISFYCEASPASQNYDYNDVVITVRFTGTYGSFHTDTLTWDDVEIDETVTFELNIGGNGSGNKIVPIELYTFEDLIKVNYEVVEISGNVSKN